MEPHADFQIQHEHVSRIEGMESRVGSLEREMATVRTRQDTVWNTLFGDGDRTGMAESVLKFHTSYETREEERKDRESRRFAVLTILILLLGLLVAIVGLPQLARIGHSLQDNAPQILTPQGISNIIHAAIEPGTDISRRTEPDTASNTAPTETARW